MAKASRFTSWTTSHICPFPGYWLLKLGFALLCRMSVSNYVGTVKHGSPVFSQSDIFGLQAPQEGLDETNEA
jgi:hypothetical protein